MDDLSWPKDAAVAKRLERLLLEGAGSGEGIAVTPDYWLRKEEALKARFASQALAVKDGRSKLRTHK